MSDAPLDADAVKKLHDDVAALRQRLEALDAKPNPSRSDRKARAKIARKIGRVLATANLRPNKTAPEASPPPHGQKTRPAVYPALNALLAADREDRAVEDRIDRAIKDRLATPLLGRSPADNAHGLSLINTPITPGRQTGSATHSLAAPILERLTGRAAHSLAMAGAPVMFKDDAPTSQTDPRKLMNAVERRVFNDLTEDDYELLSNGSRRVKIKDGKTLYDYWKGPAPRKPVNRETAKAALRPKGLLASSEASDLLASGTGLDYLWDVLDVGEWFDFGAVDVGALRKAAMDSRDFIKAGLINLPYPKVVFRIRMNNVEVEEARNPVEVLMALSQPDAGMPIDMMFVTVTGLEADTMLLAQTATFKGWNETEQPLAIGAGTHLNVAGAFFACWLILNTRGLEKHVDEPAPELNKARAKAGKPPLRRVTRLNAQQYITSLQQTEKRERGEHHGGSHASPVPHLRRGHVRTYRHERFATMPADQRTRWIWPMIVNGEDDLKEVARRAKYKLANKKEG